MKPVHDRFRTAPEGAIRWLASERQHAFAEGPLHLGAVREAIGPRKSAAQDDLVIRTFREEYLLFSGQVMSVSGALDEWLAERLSADDIVRLSAVDVRASGQHRFDLAGLLRGWKRHVDKVEHDLPLPSSDRSVWGAHDVVAAVSLRGFLQEGLDELEPGLRQRVQRVIGEVDERYLSYTEVDELGLLEQIDGRSNPSRGWWWKRIPKTGPAREEINLYGGQG